MNLRNVVQAASAAAMFCWTSPSLAQAVPTLPPAAPPSAMASVGTPDGPLVVHTRTSNLRLIERGSRVIELPDNITHVTDFDPNVIEVAPISPTTVRVLAVSPGVTSIVFTDVHQVARTLEVFVAGDTRHLEAHLEYLFPDASIRAYQVGQNVVLRGYVSQPSQITEIYDVATEFYPTVHNQLQVSTNDRVVLHAKVAEVNRSRLRQFGVNFNGFGNSAFLNNVTGGIGPASAFADSTLFALQEGVLANPNLTFAYRTTSGEYGAFIEALKQEAILRILAEPSVTATSGRPATLLSGGEFPILVPQGLGQTAIEFRQFGVSIEAVAVVLGNGRIRLDISPEVSDLDFTNGVTLDGIRIPGLTTRRVNTQAEMKFGETLVLGGLISKRRIGSTTKVPFLGELPVIGAAFSRKRYENAETELLIMVTPTPAAPFQPGEPVPPGPGENSSDPTDKELYWEGRLELPNYGDACEQNGCQPGMGGMIMPQGCTPGMPPMSPPVPVQTFDAGPAVINYPTLESTPYATGETFGPTTSTSTTAPAAPTAEITTPTATTPEVKAPTFESLPVNQISYRSEPAVGAPQIKTPTTVNAAAEQSTASQPLRQRFNPFARRAKVDTINAPKPSGPAATSGQQAPTTTSSLPPASRPATSTAGLIKPAGF